jgi:hypothetical protein
MVAVTKHAEKRIRKRLGLSKANIDKTFVKAIQEGRGPVDFCGAFKKFLDRKAIEHRATPTVLAQNIYWHSHGTLITVYQVPNRFKKYL